MLKSTILLIENTAGNMEHYLITVKNTITIGKLFKMNISEILLNFYYLKNKYLFPANSHNEHCTHLSELLDILSEPGPSSSPSRPHYLCR